jgi:hypothetical protein
VTDPLEDPSPLRVPNPHAWLGVAVVAAYLGCAAIAVLITLTVPNDTVHRIHHRILLVTVVLVLVIALLSIAWLTARISRRTRRPGKRGRSPMRGQNSTLARILDPQVDETVAGTDPAADRERQIRDWVTDFYDRYHDDLELSKTARIVLRPGRYVQRAIQTVIPNDLCTLHKVAREIRIPGEPSSKTCRVVVPVLTLRKESMVDSLDVECDGASALTLGYKESQGATLWLAALLMHRAGVPEDQRDQVLRKIASEVCEVAPTLTARAGRPGATAPTALEEAQKFVTMVSKYRILYVEASTNPGARVSVKVQWSSNRHDRYHSLSDKVRAFVGLGPTSIAGETAGVEAASWHLRVQAPPGTHMKRVSLFVPPDTRPKKAFVLTSNGIAGRELAHVRVRRLELPDGHDVPAYFRAHLGETPPGIGGPLAILTLALATTIWSIGVFYEKAFPPVAKHATAKAVLRHPGGVTAAVMLTLISGVSAWLVSRFSEEAVRRAQLREVVALFAVMVTSGAALFSTALRLARARIVGSIHPGLLGAHVEIENTVWFAVMIVSGALLLMAWGGLVVRTSRLSRMIRRSRDNAF